MSRELDGSCHVHIGDTRDLHGKATSSASTMESLLALEKMCDQSEGWAGITSGVLGGCACG